MTGPWWLGFCRLDVQWFSAGVSGVVRRAVWVWSGVGGGGHGVLAEVGKPGVALLVLEVEDGAGDVLGFGVDWGFVERLALGDDEAGAGGVLGTTGRNCPVIWTCGVSRYCMSLTRASSPRRRRFGWCFRRRWASWNCEAHCRMTAAAWGRWITRVHVLWT